MYIIFVILCLLLRRGMLKVGKGGTIRGVALKKTGFINVKKIQKTKL